jgi:hypothetical protein
VWLCAAVQEGLYFVPQRGSLTVHHSKSRRAGDFGEGVRAHARAAPGGKIVSKAARIAAFILMGVAAASTGLMAADNAPAATFVSLKLEGSCDAQNNRLWLTNTHTFKTVATTVRWRAAGGKDLTDQFYPGPNSVREIGCAAEAEIVEAKFADF